MAKSIAMRRRQFGKRIKSMRMKKGPSLRQLASISVISATYLSYLARGIHGPPSHDVVKRLAVALETNVDELMKIAGYVDEDVSKVILENVDTLAPALRKAGESKDGVDSSTTFPGIVFFLILAVLTSGKEVEATPEEFYRKLQNILSEDTDKEKQLEAVEYFEEVLRLWRNDLESA